MSSEWIVSGGWMEWMDGVRLDGEWSGVSEWI